MFSKKFEETMDKMLGVTESVIDKVSETTESVIDRVYSSDLEEPICKNCGANFADGNTLTTTATKVWNIRGQDWEYKDVDFNCSNCGSSDGVKMVSCAKVDSMLK